MATRDASGRGGHPAGKSPFRAKGLVYAEAVAYYNNVVPGGFEAVREAVADEATRGFLGTTFLVGGWYDALPMVELHRAGARVIGKPYLDTIRAMATWQVPRQINGIYRFFLKLATPELVMRGSPRTANQYYDFLRVEVNEVEPRRYLTRARGVPEAFAPGYAVAAEVLIMAALEASGARNARHRLMPLEPDGEAHGVALVSVGREIRWG